MSEDKEGRLEITYQAADGYVGGRPLHCHINHWEIQEFDSVDEAVQFVEDMIQEDFLQKVSAGYDLDEIRKQVEVIMAAKKVETE